jgi:branched-chain amino acid aminotransferase
MSLPKSDWIWHNGRFIPWEEATVHVLSHVVNYGTAWFEGLRCYPTPAGPALFRLSDHLQRLLNSCRIYRLTDIGFTREQLEQACIELIRKNGFISAYVRPLVLRGLGGMGIGSVNPPQVYLAAWEWGHALGADSLELGVDFCVSSWRRLAPDTLPAMAKAAANYMNSQLIKMEALADGYAEGIALDHQGLVSEGSGQNIIVLRDGKLLTPPISASVLPGITRDSILRIAVELGIPVVEQDLPRELLYLADELFLCGTAAEITPIRSVDRIQIGNGVRGPITTQIQQRFFDLAEGRADDVYGWRTLTTSS